MSCEGEGERGDAAEAADPCDAFPSCQCRADHWDGNCGMDEMLRWDDRQQMAQ